MVSDWPSPAALKDLLEVLGLDVEGVAEEGLRCSVTASVDGRECSLSLLHMGLLRTVRIEADVPEGSPRFGVTTKGGVAAQVARAGRKLVVVTAIPGDGERGPKAMGALVGLLTEVLDGADDWAFGSLDEPVIGRVPTSLWAGGAALSAGSIAGFFAIFFAPELALLHPLSYITGPIALAIFGGAAARRHALLAAHDRARGALRALKHSAIFDTVSPIGCLEPRWPQIVLADGDGFSLGAAVVRVAALEAESSRHGLRLALRLHRTVWPDAFVEGDDLVPGSWAVARLSGPDEALAAAPTLPGEERSEGRLRALLTEGDLAEGALEDWLTRLETALTASSSGPYR